MTTLRIMYPEVVRELEHARIFAALPPDMRKGIVRQLRSNIETWLPDITEDTMPGELANCAAGRVQTCSISAARASPPTRRVRRHWRRWTQPSTGCSRTSSMWRSPAGSIATWASRRS